MQIFTTLYGLAYACPYPDWQDDCPLKAIEYLQFEHQKIAQI
jgi:hypothetical protein